MRPLARKLRLPPDGRVAVINAPDGYLDQLGLASNSPADDLDFVQAFVSTAAE